ncbi:gamma-butyrobetaine hydroxylase [Crassisporium funariophilum]|nr:gamma-butyrobetaine hydroxylase [Crassisporium funariophilum]
MLAPLATTSVLLRTRLDVVKKLLPFKFAQKRTWTTLSRSDDGLTVHALGDAKFPYIWLRDSCQSVECIHPSSRQKLHRTTDIPFEIAPAEEGVKVTSKGIDITWIDGHRSTFDHAFLERHASPSKLLEWHFDQHLAEQSWTNKSVSQLPDLFIPYDKIKTSAGLVDGITQLTKYGLLFVSGVPNQETSNESCELRALAERFGEIRPTFYGLLWDVVTKREGRNIAFTNLELGLHMDLLYFQHPPRYQLLHCLRNQVIGGTSIFVDGLKAARTLRDTHPADFDLLTKTPVAFHYINDGHHLHREHFTIELSPPSITSESSVPEVAHVNYSPPFQAPLPLNTPKEFFPALDRFARLLNDPQNTYEYTLREGDVVLFDNRRVLHARTAFADKPGSEKMMEGETSRWLKGCYLEADPLVDRVRVLRTKLGKDLLG